MKSLRPITRFATRRPFPRSLRAFATATDASHQQQPPSNNNVKLVEVGPRDGLQNEKTTIPLSTKIELIQKLAKTGLTTIEAGSFVSPKWVPQVSPHELPLESRPDRVLRFALCADGQLQRDPETNSPK